jgi:GNAT superfamily N-acetyltransferase
MSDEALAATIGDPVNELHVLHVDDTPAGFAELDRRQPDEIELVQFGLVPEFIGQGLGNWFLQWTVDKAWGYQPRRFWLHTCTLDHPVALPNYLKAGFVLFNQETKKREL